MKRRLELVITFKEDTSEPNTWGSNAIVYIIYLLENKIINIEEEGAFGDKTLVKRYKADTFEEGIDFIKEISQMDYETFKEKLLKK